MKGQGKDIEEQPAKQNMHAAIGKFNKPQPTSNRYFLAYFLLSNDFFIFNLIYKFIHFRSNSILNI